MKFEKPKASAGVGGGPSSAIGIMRFFDSDSGGPKISPEFVMILTTLFAFGILFLHFFI